MPVVAAPDRAPEFCRFPRVRRAVLNEHGIASGSQQRGKMRILFQFQPNAEPHPFDVRTGLIPHDTSAQQRPVRPRHLLGHHGGRLRQNLRLQAGYLSNRSH